MIEFQSVSKDYPGSAGALSEVSLKVGAGQLLFLTGPSGAGKSTLLKLAAAMERPSGGNVVVGGQDIGRLHRSALPYLRRKLGLIMPAQRLLAERDVLSNVMLPLQVSGESSREAEKRALAALERVGLAHKARQAPATLSGGEQQRAMVARAIVHRPQVILADEPTANLDREAATQVMDLLRAFNQAGVTCVIATHDELSMRERDQVACLRAGRLQAAGEQA
jgi:cell division transport system ATP-binding protein